LREPLALLLVVNTWTLISIVFPKKIYNIEYHKKSTECVLNGLGDEIDVKYFDKSGKF
jgi:hypothetical protein